MSRPATARLKVNPPLGRMPTLQFCRPAELRVDPAYQRDVGNGPSQALIRRIAQHWNWDLCQPLVVARRVDLTERLFVIDGQHRLEAARLRRDIDQLPCVIVTYADAGEEAANFVALNQQRRPLSKLDVFKAALASGDGQAAAIGEALAAAGLGLAKTTNTNFWKPGELVNIGGIERAWQSAGAKAASAALRVLAAAWRGQVLRYAGTIYPGLVAVCADVLFADPEAFADGSEAFEMLVEMVGASTQAEWYADIGRAKADDANLNTPRAAAAVMRAAWAELMAEFMDGAA